MADSIQDGTSGGESSSLVYGWSLYPDEGFQGAYSSKEEALEEARKGLGTFEDIYILSGRYEEVTKVAPSKVAVAISVLTLMNEAAGEECGGAEDIEGWPEVDAETHEELENELDAVIKKWMRKHLQMPAWEPVGEPELFKGEA